MKNIIKIKSLLLVFVAVFMASCDLEVQDSFEFDPEIQPQVTFGALTPWEWLQTNPNGEFTYLLKAIELTNTQDAFSTNLKGKTFLLIKDEGFRNADRNKKWIWKKEMLTYEFNLPNRPQNAAELDLFTPAQLASLKNLLLYHIITTYVDQGPEHLFVKDQDYIFTTVFQGAINNKMSLRRNRNYGIEFNRDDTLPTTRKGGSVSLHNYIFDNGSCVAHLLTDYTRLAAFDSE